MIEETWLDVKCPREWSSLISLKEVDLILIPAYPSGALVSVRFRCTHCDRWLVAYEVKIPAYADGCYVFGDTVDVECNCRAEYQVEANNSSSGWDVEIERQDSHSIKKKDPDFFQFHLERDNGYCDEIIPDVKEPKGRQSKMDDFLYVAARANF